MFEELSSALMQKGIAESVEVCERRLKQIEPLHGLDPIILFGINFYSNLIEILKFIAKRQQEDNLPDQFDEIINISIALFLNKTISELSAEMQPLWENLRELYYDLCRYMANYWLCRGLANKESVFNKIEYLTNLIDWSAADAQLTIDNCYIIERANSEIKQLQAEQLAVDTISNTKKAKVRRKVTLQNSLQKALSEKVEILKENEASQNKKLRSIDSRPPFARIENIVIAVTEPYQGPKKLKIKPPTYAEKQAAEASARLSERREAEVKGERDKAAIRKRRLYNQINKLSKTAKPKPEVLVLPTQTSSIQASIEEDPIPSTTMPGKSVAEEFKELLQADPNSVPAEMITEIINPEPQQVQHINPLLILLHDDVAKSENNLSIAALQRVFSQQDASQNNTVSTNELINRLKMLEEAFNTIINNTCLENGSKRYAQVVNYPFWQTHNRELSNIQLRHISYLKAMAAVIGVDLANQFNFTAEQIVKHAPILIPFNLTRVKAFTKQQDNWLLSKYTNTEKKIRTAANAAVKLRV